MGESAMIIHLIYFKGNLNSLRNKCLFTVAKFPSIDIQLLE